MSIHTQIAISIGEGPCSFRLCAAGLRTTMPLPWHESMECIGITLRGKLGMVGTLVKHASDLPDGVKVDPALDGMEGILLGVATPSTPQSL